MHFLRIFLTRLLPFSAAVLMLQGCAPMLTQSLNAPSVPYGQPDRAEPSIIVHTYDNSELRFEDGWSLTFGGISGTAEVIRDDAPSIRTDTTLAYQDVASAAPSRRNTTMRQFLLTILGVILVIGLAAIILYAAFIATGR